MHSTRQHPYPRAPRAPRDLNALTPRELAALRASQQIAHQMSAPRGPRYPNRSNNHYAQQRRALAALEGPQQHIRYDNGADPGRVTPNHQRLHQQRQTVDAHVDMAHPVNDNHHNHINNYNNYHHHIDNHGNNNNNIKTENREPSVQFQYARRRQRTPTPVEPPRDPTPIEQYTSLPAQQAEYDAIFHQQQRDPTPEREYSPMDVDKKGLSKSQKRSIRKKEARARHMGIEMNRGVGGKEKGLGLEARIRFPVGHPLYVGGGEVEGGKKKGGRRGRR